MSVHVVIVTWNGRDDTLRCLANVARCVPEPRHVHVVDNGSTDGTADALAEAPSGVTVHALDHNAGFAAGANVGVRAALDAGAEWVFLLNNDATVEPETLPALLAAAARHPSVGLLGGRIYLDRGRDVLWCCGVAMGWWPNLCRLRGHGRSGSGRYVLEESVPGLTGCGLLVRREVWEQVGLLDEDYFVYVEDADLCARARAAGFGCLYVPSAIMEHRAAGSTGGGYSRGRKYLTAYGSVLFLKRHGTVLLWAGYVCVDFLLWPLLLLISLPAGRARGAIAKLRGMLDAFRGRPVDRGVVSR